MQSTIALHASSHNPLAHMLAWLAGSPLVGPAPHREPHWAQTQHLEQVHMLERGETLAIQAPQGQSVWCSGGALWITHDGQPADHVIEPGSYYIAKCTSRMLVHALDACTVHVTGR